MVGFSFTPCPECGEQCGYVLGVGDYNLRCIDCAITFDRRTEEVIGR